MPKEKVTFKHVMEAALHSLHHCHQAALLLTEFLLEEQRPHRAQASTLRKARKELRCANKWAGVARKPLYFSRRI